jgi:alkylated DNA repair dioxygenase AlkB
LILDEVPILLKPRSLLVLSGSSRYDWKHGIAAIKLISTMAIR